MSHTAYRADIDGMRAIAVCAVVLFHLDIAALAGGFIGVDIFFVISGFLISSIMWEKIQKDTFRLGDFYLNRIRRLLPALFVTVFATFLASAFILLPDDFARFSRTAIASLFSVSNVLFYLEAGYWDTSSHLKPLLHTWSLGVEEQFYLIWPVFLIACGSVLRRIPLVAILAVVSGLSTWAMLWFSAQDLSGAFYLFPFRIFQFALGALVAFSTRLDFVREPLRLPFVADALTIIGLASLVYLTLTLGSETPFPGWNALPPTLAAMLILYAGCGKSGQGPVGKALLENSVSVFLGKISYAGYLVHWPIIVLYRYHTADGFTAMEMAGLAAATLLAASLLHYGVERQFYRRAGERKAGRSAQRTSPTFAAGTLIAGLILSGIAAHAYLTSGWMWRFPQVVLTPEAIEQGKQARFQWVSSACGVAQYPNDPRCAEMTDRSIDVLFFGNSHEPDGYNFVRSGFSESEPLNLIKFGTINRCGEIARVGTRWIAEDEQCQDRLDRMMSAPFLEGLDVVVISTFRVFSLDNLTSIQILEDMRQSNPALKIVVFGGYIGMKEHCSYLTNKSGSSAACRDPENVDYFEDSPESFALHDRLGRLMDAYIDRVGLHCAGRQLDNCETQAPDGELFSYDRHHASFGFATYGGEVYAARYPDFFKELLGSDYPSAQASGSPQPELVYQLSPRFNELRATPAVDIEPVGDGARLIPIGPFNENRLGGDTGVAHIGISGMLEGKLSGQKIRVRITGVAEAATDVWLQYSTNDVGNSGWVQNQVEPGPFEMTLQYSIPPMVRGGGDFIGIAPISQPIHLTDIVVEIVD